MTAAIGAVAAVIAAAHLRALTSIALSLAAGTFLGATDLLPEIHVGDGPADRRGRLLGSLHGNALILVATVLEAL